MVANNVLAGVNQLDINNEIRFLVASARVDGKALVRFSFSEQNPEKQKQSAIRVLRSLKREDAIEFFVLGEDLDADSTEAVFLINKYGDYVSPSGDCIYVKL